MSNLRSCSGVLCAVQSCRVSRRTHPERQFFKFPLKDKIFDVWMDKCGLSKTSFHKNLKICDKHFNSIYIGKRKLLKYAVPEYYLNHPHIRSEFEDEIQTIRECNNSTSSLTLNESVLEVEPALEVITIQANENPVVSGPCKNTSDCLQNKRVKFHNSVHNLTFKSKRFNKVIKYYKGKINFLKKEIRMHRKVKSENMRIDSLSNLSSAAKELGKLILNGSVKDWPCIKCMEEFKVAILLKEDTLKSDNKKNLESIENDEETMSNSQLTDDRNSNSEPANLTTEEFEECLSGLGLAAVNDVVDFGLVDESIAANEKYECSKCEEKHDTYKQLIFHMRFHPDMNLYECERCGKEFHHYSRYRSHGCTHSLHKPFICKICKKRFKGRIHLRQHKLSHKTERIYPCPHCDKRFCHKKGLNHHLVYNHKEKHILCSMCDKKFHYNSQLISHMGLYHYEMDNGNRKPIERVEKSLQKQFACEKCGKLFSTEMTLKHHIKCIHNKEKLLFPCSFCSKAFRLSASLMCHIQHHINSKDSKIDPKTLESYLKYKCDECDKAFTTNFFLKKHKIIHSGSKDYVCTQCGKGFAFKWYLVRHVRLVHDTNDPRNFVCSICRKVSANIWALESHMLSHTGETPFHCTFCDSKFRYKKSLQIHIATLE